MALPSNVSYGTVVGRFMRAVADGRDPGRDPDGIPLVGLSLRFEPSATVFKNLTATPPVTIIADTIQATTDADGYVIGPDGGRGVRLLATDDPDLDPTGWTWRVTVSGPSIQSMSLSFLLPADATVDLTSVVPVPSDPGSSLPQWEVAVAATKAARDEALLARDKAVAAAEQATAPTEQQVLTLVSKPGPVKDQLSATFASKAEARKSLAGLFSRKADGSPRQGLLTPLTVAGTSGWAYSVPAASWVTSRGAVDGVVLSGNDGTVQIATDPAPATGSRIDIIYVLNRDVDNADTDSEAIVGVAVGAASGTPVAPSIPTGAMEIARATVLSTNANTSQATIQQTAPMTGLAGADIIVPFGLASFDARIPDPVTGMKVFSTAENTLYLWVDGAWRPFWARRRPVAVTPVSGFTVGNGALSGAVSINGGTATFQFSGSLGSSSEMTWDLRVAVPSIAPAAPDAVADGIGLLSDVSENLNFDATTTLISAVGHIALRPIDTAGAHARHVATTPNVPFVWAAGDTFTGSITYSLA